MLITIFDKETKQEHTFSDVEQIINIRANYTQCEELKDKLLIIHRCNHIEKYRLYNNAIIVEIKEK